MGLTDRDRTMARIALALIFAVGAIAYIARTSMDERESRIAAVPDRLQQVYTMQSVWGATQTRIPSMAFRFQGVDVTKLRPGRYVIDMHDVRNSASFATEYSWLVRIITPKLGRPVRSSGDYGYPSLSHALNAGRRLYTIWEHSGRRYTLEVQHTGYGRTGAIYEMALTVEG